jgi:hypothetical protein
MTTPLDPYANEYGVSLFDFASDAYDQWLVGLPYVAKRSDGTVKASAQPKLVCDVWPTIQPICIRLEANGKAELGARLERAFRDVEDYARIIDHYCESDAFGFNLWAYGDPVLATLPAVDAEPQALLAQAEEIGECELSEELYFTAFEREWAAEVGRRCAETEIEKYGHLPTDDYAERAEMRAWACFWLAAQLRRHGLSHGEASGYLEEYLSRHGVVCETKTPVIREALGRAFGMGIYPLPVMESEEVRAALDGLWTALSEIRGATAPPPGVPELSEGPLSYEDLAPLSVATAADSPEQDGEDVPGEPAPSGQDAIGSRPEPDPYDPRAVNWFGKRLYLGAKDSQVARLFWVLAKRLGHACPWDEIRRSVFDESAASPTREVKQVKQHVRTIVSKLKDRLEEHGLADHVLITCETPRQLPSYTMIVRSSR